MAKDSIEGVHKLRPPSIIQRHRKLHSRVLGGLLHGSIDIGTDLRRQLVVTPNDEHADIVSMQDRQLLSQIFAEQAHQEIDFSFGSAPIFHGERVKSEGRNAQARAGFNYPASGLGSRAMAGDTRKMAALRPAAISIHDYGNMLRESVRVQFKEQPLFLEVRRLERFRCFHATIPANSMEWTEAVPRAYGKANIGPRTVQHAASDDC